MGLTGVYKYTLALNLTPACLFYQTYLLFDGFKDVLAHFIPQG